MFRLLMVVARMQLRMTRRNVEDLFPILTIPLSSAIALAILQSSGRDDLAGYALVAVGLMSIGQMAFFVGSEILATEREGQTLELIVASPTPFYIPLLCRITVLTSLGVVGFAEAWILARVVFGVHVRVPHPTLFATAIMLTVVASACTALITSTVFCFGRTTRTYQNAISGPLYLLAGVLVPVTFLPWFIQPVSRAIYLYWSAGLLREALAESAPEHTAWRLVAIVLLGGAGGGAGAWLSERLLTHLREEGRLGL